MTFLHTKNHQSHKNHKIEHIDITAHTKIVIKTMTRCLEHVYRSSKHQNAIIFSRYKVTIKYPYEKLHNGCLLRAHTKPQKTCENECFALETHSNDLVICVLVLRSFYDISY